MYHTAREESEMVFKNVLLVFLSSSKCLHSCIVKTLTLYLNAQLLFLRDTS